MVFYPFLYYLKIIKKTSRRTPAQRGGDEAFSTKGSVLSDVGRHSGGAYVRGGGHFKQNHKQATRKCVILKEPNLSVAVC